MKTIDNINNYIIEAKLIDLPTKIKKNIYKFVDVIGSYYTTISKDAIWIDQELEKLNKKIVQELGGKKISRNDFFDILQFILKKKNMKIEIINKILDISDLKKGINREK